MARRRNCVQPGRKPRQPARPQLQVRAPCTTCTWLLIPVCSGRCRRMRPGCSHLHLLPGQTYADVRWCCVPSGEFMRFQSFNLLCHTCEDQQQQSAVAACSRLPPPWFFLASAGAAQHWSIISCSRLPPAPCLRRCAALRMARPHCARPRPRIQRVQVMHVNWFSIRSCEARAKGRRYFSYFAGWLFKRMM